MPYGPEHTCAKQTVSFGNICQMVTKQVRGLKSALKAVLRTALKTALNKDYAKDYAIDCARYYAVLKPTLR